MNRPFSSVGGPLQPDTVGVHLHAGNRHHHPSDLDQGGYGRIQYRQRTDEIQRDGGDVLKKPPGVEVDKNGNITVQGKTVSRVKVNGKDFFGGDPKATTREIPADLIDKVQIIDNYGDMANVSGIRDGESE